MLLSQPKVKAIEELPAYTGYFFTEEFPSTQKARDKVMAKGDPKARLAELIELAKTADFSSHAAIEEAIKQLAAQKGLGFGDYQAVARLAVTGTNVGPSITQIFTVLGRERVLRRLARSYMSHKEVRFARPTVGPTIGRCEELA
jgi:nondiscriminating glutamyl-tRNA synthetase